jgi:hypothetical protein
VLGSTGKEKRERERRKREGEKKERGEVGWAAERKKESFFSQNWVLQIYPP